MMHGYLHTLNSRFTKANVWRILEVGLSAPNSKG